MVKIELWAASLPALVTVAAAFSRRDSPASHPLPSQEQNIDASSLLHPRALHHHSELFSNAVRILDSLKSHPSCNRLAASDLLSSCQSLTTTNHHGSASGSGSPKADPRLLDTVKSLYAARLALCELEDAGAYLPDECVSVASSQRHHHHYPILNSKRTREFDRLLLEPCLKALESKPQWWTSYSNNRQNAAIMCEAARIEIDKEEQVEAYRDLVNVTSFVAEVLGETHVQIEVERGKQEEFMVGIERKREDMLGRFFTDAVLMKNAFEEMVRDIERSRGLVEVGGIGLEGLSKEITTSATTTKKLSEELGRIYDWITHQRSEMEHTELQKQEHSLAALSTLQNRLDELNARDVSSAVNFIDTVLLSLNEMSEAVKTLNQNHNELDLRLQRSEKTFTDLEHLSTSFQQRQLQHLQQQATIQKSFQQEMELSKDILTEIKVAAQDLQAEISNAREAFSSLAKLGETLRSGHRYIWLGLGFAFMQWCFRRDRLAFTVYLLLFRLLWSMYFEDNIDYEMVHAIAAWLEAKKRILWMVGAAVAVGVIVGVYVRSRLRRRQREQAEKLPVSEVAGEKGKTPS